MVIKNKNDLIYQSWVKLFWNFWVKKVSIDMIVKDAWIAKGTFYLYYKNKEELYETIIDDILQHCKTIMEHLVKNIPDIKERFYLHMIWSLSFFKQNKIVKNLIDWNNDYYIWKINQEYLYSNHIKFMKILLWDDFTDETFITFVANVKWFFANSINNKKCFESEEQFEDFVMNFAAVIVNGLFSDYKSIMWKESFKDISKCINKLK
jgi:AcrR family transcriptional regulator